LEKLSRLPPTLIITDENDVLRDEGESYAHKLMAAGVEVSAVRILGTIHDFMMLNPLSGTAPTRCAIRLVIATLKEVLQT
jgi:acetyl esterase